MEIDRNLYIDFAPDNSPELEFQCKAVSVAMATLRPEDSPQEIDYGPNGILRLTWAPMLGWLAQWLSPIQAGMGSGA